jgi:hypothetical protein
MMYVASFLIGTATAFQSPSLRSMLPTLVPRTLLPRCLAWSGAVRKGAVVTVAIVVLWMRLFPELLDRDVLVARRTTA